VCDWLAKSTISEEQQTSTDVEGEVTGTFGVACFGFVFEGVVRHETGIGPLGYCLAESGTVAQTRGKRDEVVQHQG